MKFPEDEHAAPMTHDLMCDMLGELDAKCTQVSVTELRRTRSSPRSRCPSTARRQIDSRPSDALALAVRPAPRSSRPDRVTPEDFLGGEDDQS